MNLLKNQFAVSLRGGKIILIVITGWYNNPNLNQRQRRPNPTNLLMKKAMENCSGSVIEFIRTFSGVDLNQPPNLSLIIPEGINFVEVDGLLHSPHKGNQMENHENNQAAYRSTIDQLCHPKSYQKVIHRFNHDVPMPSTETLNDIVELARSIIFPGYFGSAHLTLANMQYYLGYTLDRLDYLLTKQIKRGFCFDCPYEENSCIDCNARAKGLSMEFVKALPEIRYVLSTDVQAAYEGDPAAKRPGETIFCYPSIRTLTNFRIAHQLHTMGVPLIPRIITELAHSETGVDIHPGATIGEKFFMDHCTGIVIGETTIIGKNVRVYQGVTLGAKSFPLDAEGNPIKGIARHPIVEDDVIIYSGATILGRVTIGKGSVIGGNIWITRDVASNSKVLQGKPRCTEFVDGAGI